MSYYDEELLKMKKELERQQYTTLATGIYVDDDLLRFSERSFPALKFSIFLPDSFVKMPQKVKDVKYPSKNAPSVLLTNLDTAVNFGFNSLPYSLQDKELIELSYKFQTAITNLNPSVTILFSEENKTSDGSELCWFDFIGYSIDGQSYNRMFFIRMSHFVIHGIFNCPDRDKTKWYNIVELIFETTKETAV